MSGGDHRDATSHGTWWRPALVAAGVVAVATTVFVVTRADGVPASGSTPPSPYEPDRFAAITTRDGDPVQAIGSIVRAPGEPAMMCETLPVADVAWSPGEEPPAECSPIAVPLTGLDTATVPGWVERDGVWFTDLRVVVDGVWQDGTLAVDTVAADEPPWVDESSDSWTVPCEPPAGGWMDGDGLLTQGMTPEAYEAVGAALAAELEAHPERYHGRWIGYPDGDPFGPDAPTTDMGEPMPEHLVMVVSTVDDPAEVQSRLAAIYPGNLCVTRVDHSAADLDAVVDRLTAQSPAWMADAHALQQSLTNSVLLTLPVLDEDAVARIGADAPLVEVRPLVRPLVRPS